MMTFTRTTHMNCAMSFSCEYRVQDPPLISNVLLLGKTKSCGVFLFWSSLSQVQHWYNIELYDQQFYFYLGIKNPTPKVFESESSI